jgi:hypothetical protein
MANRFNYEGEVNRLLSITVPQFINRALDRQEGSRRFDKEMDLKIDQLNQAQDNFDEQIKITKEQNKFDREQTLKAEDRADDKLIIDEIFKTKTISGRKQAIENEGLVIKTDAYKNRLKVAGSELESIAVDNKRVADIYRGISPELGRIADAQVDNIDFNIDSDVLKFLQIQGATNAQRGSAIIANYKEAAKLRSELSQRFSVGMASEDELKSAEASFKSAQQLLTSYINSDPVLTESVQVTLPGEDVTVTADGSMDNPYIVDENFDKSLLAEGIIVKSTNAEGEDQLYRFTSDGDFELVMSSTPDDIQYRTATYEEPTFKGTAPLEEVGEKYGEAYVQPSGRQEIEERLAGLGQPLGFLGRAASDFSPIMRYSPKQSYKAVKNFEQQTDNLLKSMDKSWVEAAQKSPGMFKVAMEDLSASEKYQSSAVKLQNLVTDGYGMYLMTDPNTKGGKILRKKLRMKLNKLVGMAKRAEMKPGGVPIAGKEKGMANVLKGNQDLIDLLLSLEL